ncbi:MAG: hypothetical protein V2A73_19840, partial [Pseudomonadota bacterium]
MSSTRLDEIADRGSRAIAGLRESAGFLAQRLLYLGPELLDLEATPPGIRARITADFERVARIQMLYPYWIRGLGRIMAEARRIRGGKPVRVLDIGARQGHLLFRIEDWARRRRVPVELHGLDLMPDVVQAARR